MNMPSDKATDTNKAQKRKRWSKTVIRCESIVMKLSGAANKVFLCLKSHTNLDGYCWVLVSTIQTETGIKDPATITAAFEALERKSVLYRAKLVSKKNGSRAPDLYRIGRKIQHLPRKAAKRFELGNPRTKQTLCSAEHFDGRIRQQSEVANPRNIHASQAGEKPRTEVIQTEVIHSSGSDREVGLGSPNNQPKAELPKHELAWDRFSRAYPNPAGLDSRWTKHKFFGCGAHEAIEEVLTGIDAWKTSAQWSEPQFIPYAQRFLENKLWQIVPPTKNGVRNARFTDDQHRAVIQRNIDVLLPVDN